MYIMTVADYITNWQTRKKTDQILDMSLCSSHKGLSQLMPATRDELFTHLSNQ